MNFPLERGEAEVWSLGLLLSLGVEKRLRRGMVWYRVNTYLAGSVPTVPREDYWRFFRLADV